MKIGTLYIVATPIGNLGDMSQRAIETLRKVHIIAAEDTRHSAKLLQHFDIETPMVSLHKFNETERNDKILHELKQGKEVALISDAGTPLVSDPGYLLVSEAKKCEIDVITIPGPCAAIAALSISGLSSDQFVFEGFLSAKQNARLQQLEKLKLETRTLIFYESPHRILECLQDMIEVFGENREAVIARELTKIFETVKNDSLINLFNWLNTHTDQQCGEFVILVRGAEETIMDDRESQRILEILLQELSVKQATQLAAEITGKRKNALYELALQLKKS